MCCEAAAESGGARLVSRPVSRHRWVVDEPHIPFDFDVIYEDAGIIVIDKPHFLATTPRGMWYRETALIRLREMYDDDSITPAHRLDRATAGIVLFVRDPALRGAYQMLFQERRAVKTYECLAAAAPARRPRYGTVECLEPPRVFPLRRRSRIIKDRGVLQAFEVPGEVNAETVIELSCDAIDAVIGGAAHGVAAAGSGDRGAVRGCGSCVRDRACGSCACGSCTCERECGRRNVCGRGRALCRSVAHTAGSLACPAILRSYALHPRTGWTHQLRVHMNSLGLPIVGDDLYPQVIDRPYDDFSHPLQLVARRLSFIDPVCGEPREFVSRIPLASPLAR